MAQRVPEAISGIDAMRGAGQVRAKGFWSEAWGRVFKRPAAILSIGWIGLVAVTAVLAPLLANAHPILLERIGDKGEVLSRSWPLLENLTPTDLLLLLGSIVAIPWLLPTWGLPRSQRLTILVAVSIQAGLSIVILGLLREWLGSAERSESLRQWSREMASPYIASAVVAAIAAAVVIAMPLTQRRGPRVLFAVAAALLVTLAVGSRWQSRLTNFERYAEEEATGKIRAVYTVIPWSPEYVRSDMALARPASKVFERLPSMQGTPLGARPLYLGSDSMGGDVLSQMLWACRLSISIGIVSTGISLLIGVTLGALAGYFGGRIDLLLQRLIEIFMAIPVLFLLIVAAGVLPRNTYVMMAIIGCFSWTGAARFTRAEFLKLRRQDFVQSAQAVGLPLRMILFRHMLPNGVTPVLVDASFSIAAAISVEATLSFLGLGPDGQASWGKLLSSATASTGTFVWWLAVFPGLAIFLSVLSYNLLGESLRDAIDPKLRKAAH
ncbi:MAG: ABC transporter permease [Planctomycetes bacterium]|nr:ABC transporter permease [Planctomycetota bacterium]